MNSTELFLARIARKIYQRIIHRKTSESSCLNSKINLRGQTVSDHIEKLLLDDKPCLVARFGEVELDAILTHYFMQNPKLIQYKNFISGISHRANWEEDILRPLHNNAGVFPKNKKTAQRFSIQYLNDIPYIDVLGSWQEGEIFLEKELSQALWVSLAGLEPYYHQTPWSQALENQKVLVIHPFEASIRKQYKKRKLLFKDTRILPDFELKTLKAIQSITGINPEGFADWFEALEYMKHQISAIEFDIAIIGCGAYGLPLGAYVKRIGKKAIHLGGATQILFGIGGKRWDHHPVIAPLYNEHWCRPLASETPQLHQQVEGGCYW